MKILIISIIIHMLLLSISINNKPVVIKEPKKPKQSKIKIKMDSRLKGNPSKDDELFILSDALKKIADMNKGVAERAMVKSWIRDCSTFYFGIGVIDSLTGITQITKGSLAEIAGIQLGDILLDKDIKDKYPEGTNVTIPILRKGITHNIPIIIGKICTGKKQP